MSRADSLAPRARLVLLLAALACALHAASYLGAGPFDDDYIVYRYARHWVEGHGLVFNVGERFEGFTQPLWVLLVAAGLRLGIDPVHLSVSIGIASTALAAWAVGRAWLQHLPAAVWPVPALLLACMPALAWHAVAGLATTLLAALLAGFGLAWERAERGGTRPWLAAALLGLACLVRQECALLAVPFVAVCLRRRQFGPALLPVVSLVGWTLFRLGYYGRWLPITYGVKKLAPADDLVYGLRYLLRSTAQCGVLVFLVGAWLGARRSTSARAIVLGLTLHTLYVVWVGGDFMQHARFFVPTLPLLVHHGCVGWRGVLAVGQRGRAALVVVAGLALTWPGYYRAQVFGEQRFFEQRWLQLGRWFGRVLPADTRVAISPIGAFGWASRLPLVDILGLTHDATQDEAPDLEVHVKGHHRFDPAWVLAQRPGLMILGNGVRQPSGTLAINPWERELYLSPRFQADYVHALCPVPGEGTAEAGVPVDVFLRRGEPLPPGAQLSGG